MAMETGSGPTAPSAQLIGNAFVEQYYHILHHSPELVHRFYQDSSLVSRPDFKGEMTSVTTMQGINEKILSLNFKEFKVEIKTADAQKSYKEGVTVLVTGCLTGKDNKTRSFAQSFFLAPQENGYFVLNDVFRYVEDHEPSEPHPVNGDSDAAAVTVNPEPEPVHASDSTAAPDLANASVNEGPIVAEGLDELSNHLEKQIPGEIEDPVEPQVQSNGNDDSQVTELDSSTQEDAPKKSYASIVKVQKASGPAKIYVPTNTVKTEPNKTPSQLVKAIESVGVPEAAPDSIAISESGGNPEEGEGQHTIYIRNLPMGVTAADIEEEFGKFGPIKPRGIQVRDNKQGYCFGFVEFLSQDSMNSAIQASPVNFGGRKVVVEMKRSTAQVGSGTSNPGRARVPSSRRGGFRNDNNRGGGLGNYGGGWGYGRNGYGGFRGEFSGRGRGLGGSHGEGYQQARARGPRSSGPKPNAAAN